MAEDPQLKTDTKRKYEDPNTPLPRRQTGFSAPIVSPSADSLSTNVTPQSYNNVPPPPDEIQLAKQRAQEIAARLFSSAEAKRPRLENGGIDDGINRPFNVAAAYAYQGTSKRIDIPNAKVGVIIGKGGETIKYLQLQSGARIQVTRDMDADPNSFSRSVELMGTPEQISKAEQLISDVIAEADSGGSGLLAAKRLPSEQTGSDQVIMKVPNNKVGLIIGKGGDTIKNMQIRSGARIQLIPLHLPPGDTSTERTVHIDGTKEQIESAMQLVNEIVNDTRIRTPMAGGYSQQVYRPPRPAANWGMPGPQMQQPGYGYMQPGVYPATPQYNASQPPYAGYPQPQPAGYSSGWDQSVPTNQVSAGGGYEYYNQQLSQQQQPSAPSGSTGDSAAYSYAQPPNPGYAPQVNYGEAQYPPPIGQQQVQSQDAYGSAGVYYTPASQSGYTSAPAVQTGYDPTQQAYSSTPGYSSMTSGSQDSAATYATQSGATAMPSQQTTPMVQPVATPPQGAFAGQLAGTAASNYSSQGAPAQPGYVIASQPGYGTQLQSQTGLQSATTAYSQAPPGQKPTVAPSYPPGSQQTPSQPSFVNPVQAGFTQNQTAVPGYGQQDSGQQCNVPYSYAPAVPQPAYGQQLYSVPPTVAQTGFQQPQPQPQQYSDPYSSGNGYAQPQVYSSDGGAAGNTHATYDAQTNAGAQPPQNVVTKTSPQA